MFAKIMWMQVKCKDCESIFTPFSHLGDKIYEINKNENEKITLHKLSLENPKRIIIIPIKNQYHCLTEFTKNELDLLMILETKLDSSFP